MADWKYDNARKYLDTYPNVRKLSRYSFYFGLQCFMSATVVYLCAQLNTTNAIIAAIFLCIGLVVVGYILISMLNPQWYVHDEGNNGQRHDDNDNNDNTTQMINDDMAQHMDDEKDDKYTTKANNVGKETTKPFSSFADNVVDTSTPRATKTEDSIVNNKNNENNNNINDQHLSNKLNHTTTLKDTVVTSKEAKEKAEHLKRSIEKIKGQRLKYSRDRRKRASELEMKLQNEDY
eukprot:70593_1